MRFSYLRILFAAGASLAMLLLGLAPSGTAASRTLGDSTVIADIPDDGPGFPEGVAVSGSKIYVSSPAQFGHKGDAHVYEFDALNGNLLRDYPIPATDPITDHALVGVALDGSGHLYVADIQLPGVVQLDLATGNTTPYAKVPNLFPCPSPLGEDCSPTTTERPPFPNDLAFDSDGYLYVTDSFQATIWRIPPGGDPTGSNVERWFQHPDFDRPFGPNGIRISPKGNEVCSAVTGPPGGIHCIGIGADPLKQATYHQVLHPYETEGPDNMAFGQSGKLYVALAFSNQVGVLQEIPKSSPTKWEEVRRFSGPAQGPNGAVPWDAPAGVAFNNASGSLVVANHALNTGVVKPELFVVFDVFVNDRARPLNKPTISSLVDN